MKIMFFVKNEYFKLNFKKYLNYYNQESVNGFLYKSQKRLKVWKFIIYLKLYYLHIWK